MAQVITGLDNIPISAASAAYAPTNTADVTAMIDSAVSAKLDASASSSFQPSGDYVSSSDLSGYLPTSSIGVDSASAVTSIAGSSIAGGGGVVTATGTATAGDTAEPTTYVTSIDGMALSAANDTVLTAEYRVTSYDPELSASSTSTATGTATGFGVVNQNTAVAFSTASRVKSIKMNDGKELDIMASQLGAGTWQTGGKGTKNSPYFWLSFSPTNNAFPDSATTGYLSPCQYATGAGIMMSAGLFRGMLKGNELFLSREQGLDMSTATNSFTGYYLRAEGHSSRGANIGLTATKRPGGAYTGDSSECWTSIADFNQSGVSFNNTSTGVSGRNNYKASVTTAGIRLSASSPTASSQESMSLDRSALNFTANDSSEGGTGSASTTYAYTGITFEDSASTATMEKSSIGYWNGKLDASSIETSVDGITGIGGTAIADGGTTYSAGQYIQISGDEISVTGVQPSGDYVSSSELADYQPTSSMSAYATTGDLSAKLDASASSSFITSTAGLATTGDLAEKLDASASSSFVTSTADCMPLSASSDFYSTSNPAGYITGVDLTPYQTTAGMSGYLATSSIGVDTASAITSIAGSAIAGGGGAGGADWSAESGQPGYIENKPVPKTLVAGTGITITENSSELVVASTNALYSAGSGLTLNGTTFAVDTSVIATTADVSALPTNLTTAQIQAFKEAMGIDETVLWENSEGVVLHNGITLSESRLNFEYLRLTLSCQGKSVTPMCYVDIPMDGVNAGSNFQFQLNVPFNNDTTATFALTWKVLMSATNTSLQSTNALFWGKSDFDGTSANAGTWMQGSNVNVPNIYKVVGVHRIASN